MSYKKIVKFTAFSLIIFFGFLFIFPSLCYAQYSISLFNGFPDYSYGKYLELYGMPGNNAIWGSFLMSPYTYPWIGGSGSIYWGLNGSGMSSGLEIINSYLNMGQLKAINSSGSGTPGNLGGLVAPAGSNSLPEIGGLAGLLCLGSRAGLIVSGSTELITSMEF
jgi:hypothetical protein